MTDQIGPSPESSQSCMDVAKPSVPVPLDYKQLLERCIGKIELAERVLRKYEQRFSEDFSELETAVRAQDAAEVTQIAHRLRGTSANVSAEGLMQLTARLEDMGQANRFDEMDTLLEELRKEWIRFGDYVASPSVPIDISSQNE